MLNIFQVIRQINSQLLMKTLNEWLMYDRQRVVKARPQDKRSSVLFGIGNFDAFLTRRAIVRGQQLNREPNTADRGWQEQLVVRGPAARR